MSNLINKKELIRQAAVKVMSKHGFYNTKASWIADEAGIAVGTIYNYFSNKEAILDYIFEIELKKRMGYLEDIEKKDLDFYSKLALFLNKHFQEVKENLSVGEILVREKEFPKKNGSESITKYLTQIPIVIEGFIVKSQEVGEVKESIDPVIAASFIFGAVQGIVEKAINSQPEILELAAEQLIGLLKEGLS